MRKLRSAADRAILQQDAKAPKRAGVARDGRVDRIEDAGEDCGGGHFIVKNVRARFTDDFLPRAGEETDRDLVAHGAGGNEQRGFFAYNLRRARFELVCGGVLAVDVVAYFGFNDTEMVHRAIDADPLAEEMLASLPRPLHKRLAPSVAGEAIVRGIERRQARIIRPRRWAVMSVLRGVLNPLSDARLERDASTQALLRQIDARAGEDQPTTA